MKFKSVLSIIFSSVLLLVPILSQACSLSIGFAPEEHKSLIAKYFPTPALRHSSDLTALKTFKKISSCTLVWRKYKNMDALKAALINKTVDVGWLKLFNSYVVHKHNPDAKPILTVLSESKLTKKLSPYYNGYILTQAGSHGLRNITDITIHNMAFLHPHSASGFIYPVVFLIKQHILTVDEAKNAMFIDNYDLLYRKLFSHSPIKAIATWDNVILRDGHQQQTKTLKIFHNLPNPAYVASHPLSKRMVHALYVTFSQFDKIRAISPLTVKQGVTLSSQVNYQHAYHVFDQYCKMLPAYCALHAVNSFTDFTRLFSGAIHDKH